jgi:hypothetical protein
MIVEEIRQQIKVYEAEARAIQAGNPERYQADPGWLHAKAEVDRLHKLWVETDIAELEKQAGPEARHRLLILRNIGQVCHGIPVESAQDRADIDAWVKGRRRLLAT